MSRFSEQKSPPDMSGIFAHCTLIRRTRGQETAGVNKEPANDFVRNQNAFEAACDGEQGKSSWAEYLGQAFVMVTRWIAKLASMPMMVLAGQPHRRIDDEDRQFRCPGRAETQGPKRCC